MNSYQEFINRLKAKVPVVQTAPGYQGSDIYRVDGMSLWIGSLKHNGYVVSINSGPNVAVPNNADLQVPNGNGYMRSYFRDYEAAYWSIINTYQSVVDDEMPSEPTPAVYAYHYQEAPELVKVGNTQHSAINRIMAQARGTGCPFEPIIMKVWLCEDPREVKALFQGILRYRGKQHLMPGASEWFYTDLAELQGIAAVLGL